MNKKSVIVFISFITIIYTLINYYVYIRGWQAFSHTTIPKEIYTAVFLFIVLSYPLSRFFERTSWVKAGEPFIWIGSFWLAAMLYFFVIIIISDLVRAADYFIPFLPDIFFQGKNEAVSMILYVSVIGITLLIIAGFINARNPVVKKLQLSIPKKAGNLKELNIVVVSDIHIGMLIKHRMVNRLAKMVNKLNPQLVLLAGDTIDEVLEPVMKFNLGEPLKTINPPLGIYAITGNHEFIGGMKRSSAYLESLGIKVLKDEVIKISNSFYLAGRYDHDIIRFTNNKRLELEELLKDIDASFPLILLDHQPFQLDKAEKSGVDLMISGHTHHGQMWPLNYITKAIYEISWGYKKKGNSHFYVSCGYGSWAPPVRIGNRPEVVNIKLIFEK
jgi:predicted MPP superfamily phosphohydrolase